MTCLTSSVKRRRSRSSAPGAGGRRQQQLEKWAPVRHEACDIPERQDPSLWDVSIEALHEDLVSWGKASVQKTWIEKTLEKVGLERIIKCDQPSG